MFHDETSCFIQDTPSDDFFKCVPRVGAAQSCLGGELSGFTSSSGALADKFEKDSPFSVEVYQPKPKLRFVQESDFGCTDRKW